MRDALRLADYRLETVARAVLGRGKKIDQDAPDAAAEIARLWREEPEALVAYNLEDARLVLEILEREGLLALDGRAQPALGHAARPGRRQRRELRPALPARAAAARLRRAERRTPASEGGAVQGGALLEPAPGLFRNVAVFDFKSLYPSLIRTFQLDPLAHATAGADAHRGAERRALRARGRDPARRDRRASWRAARPPRRAATATPTRRSRS